MVVLDVCVVLCGGMWCLCVGGVVIFGVVGMCDSSVVCDFVTELSDIVG